MATAADIPNKFDVVIDSQGYRFCDSLDYRWQGYRSRYSATPTFLERANTSGNFGDNQQDFWLTASQHDWSLGSGQRYFVSDAQGQRQFYKSSALHIDKPGQATIERNQAQASLAEAPVALAEAGDGISVWALTPNNLYKINSGAGSTSLAHSKALSTVNPNFSLVDDGTAVYFSGGGLSNVWRYDGNTVASFSTTPSDSLCYVSNTLYGLSTLGASSANVTIVFSTVTPAGQTSPQPPHPIYFKVSDTVTQGAASGTVVSYDNSTKTLVVTPTAGTFTSGGGTITDSTTYAGATPTQCTGSPATVTSKTPGATLYRYSSSGVASSLFTWQDAYGGHRQVKFLRMRPFGGQIIMLLRSPSATELWQYDGTGTSMVAQFPGKFVGWDMDVFGGVVYISGQIVEVADALSVNTRPAVFYYANGTWGQLWEADGTFSSADDLAALKGPGISAWSGGVVWADPYVGYVCYWNASTGAVSQLGAISSGRESVLAAAASFFVLQEFGVVTVTAFPQATFSSSGILDTSMFDFESSLPKSFRGVTFDADIPTGATIDIGYRLNDPTASITTLQSAAVPGTEYTIAQSGHSLGLRFTLNKGATSGPTLKRIYVRAAPALQSFRQEEYQLELTGVTGKQMLHLRDNSQHSKNGLEMATDLRASFAKGPITVIDRFGSFTGMIEAYEFQEIKPQEFIARVTVREI